MQAGLRGIMTTGQCRRGTYPKILDYLLGSVEERGCPKTAHAFHFKHSFATSPQPPSSRDCFIVFYLNLAAVLTACFYPRKILRKDMPHFTLAQLAHIFTLVSMLLLSFIMAHSD